MDLRLLGLLAVVQCVSAVENDCRRPDIPDGYFFSEQNTFPDDTLLYYACDMGFKPVTIGWWATTTCQNGTWSPSPQCIEDTSCFDPEIPNANYTKFQLVKNGKKLWIRCKSGYEDKKKHAIAHCQNGEWTTLPVCEKIDGWCGPPPQIPNMVLINQVEDMFLENAQVKYVCQAEFELDTTDGNVKCIYGQWDSLPSCRKKQTNQDRKPVVITAAPVHTGPDDSHKPTFTPINKCGNPPTVNNGVHYGNERSVTYLCNDWYKLNGNSIVRCANGQWTQIPTCEVDFCTLDPSKYGLENRSNINIKSGTKVVLACPSQWYGYRTVHAKCSDNQLSVSRCCTDTTHSLGLCRKQ